MSESKPRRWAKSPAPFEVDIACTIDGEPFAFTTWSDMSALLAIRLNGKHGKPRRGCEAGNCGACESTLNGTLVRLCQVRPTELFGAIVVTGDN
jgi:aerobic-type carbon monoxide dehydrogenase small subunit (CoxS/CutS family)